jgi:hypothetical protein
VREFYTDKAFNSLEVNVQQAAVRASQLPVQNYNFFRRDLCCIAAVCLIQTDGSDVAFATALKFAARRSIRIT